MFPWLCLEENSTLGPRSPAEASLPGREGEGCQATGARARAGALLPTRLPALPGPAAGCPRPCRPKGLSQVQSHCLALPGDGDSWVLAGTRSTWTSGWFLYFLCKNSEGVFAFYSFPPFPHNDSHSGPGRSEPACRRRKPGVHSEVPVARALLAPNLFFPPPPETEGL